MALALQMHEDGLCKGCGNPLDECADPNAANAYEAHQPVRCHACTARAAMGEKYAENPHPSALMIPVALKPGVERAYSED